MSGGPPGGGPLEALFGDEERARRAVTRLAEERLGAPVACWTFTSERRALTCGVRLADGRGVIVKAHPAGTVEVERLRAVQRVQRRLAGEGFPCPAPLLGPIPLGRGIATAEAALCDGRRAAPRTVESDRRVMAVALAEITRRCAPFATLRSLDAARLRLPPPPGVWPEPHDPRLSLARPARELRWIDELGVRARRRRVRGAAGPPVVGHGDWHAEHVRVDHGRVAAVYDWDSVVRATEPFIVGCAVGGFTADWAVDEPPVVPGFAVAEAFVDAYEEARGRAFSADERTTIRAHWVEMTAYAARLELARQAVGLPVTGAYRAELADHGDQALRASGGRRSRC